MGMAWAWELGREPREEAEGRAYQSDGPKDQGLPAAGAGAEGRLARVLRHHAGRESRPRPPRRSHAAAVLRAARCVLRCIGAWLATSKSITFVSPSHLAGAPRLPPSPSPF